jgi:hypothetical protein
LPAFTNRSKSRIRFAVDSLIDRLATLPRYSRRSLKVTEADLQHSTILLANLWVKKG